MRAANKTPRGRQSFETGDLRARLRTRCPPRPRISAMKVVQPFDARDHIERERDRRGLAHRVVLSEELNRLAARAIDAGLQPAHHSEAVSSPRNAPLSRPNRLLASSPKSGLLSVRVNRCEMRNALLYLGSRSVVGRLMRVKSGSTRLGLRSAASRGSMVGGDGGGADSGCCARAMAGTRISTAAATKGHMRPIHADRRSRAAQRTSAESAMESRATSSCPSRRQRRCRDPQRAQLSKKFNVMAPSYAARNRLRGSRHCSLYFAR